MIHLNDKTRRQLRFIQKSNKDKRIYIKVTVILMLDKGYSATEIAETLGIDDSSVYRYQDAYIEKGLDGYLATNYLAYEGKLTPEEESQLKEELKTSLYISSPEVVEYIRQNF
jgi:transposase